MGRRWKPNEVQSVVLDRMFTGGPMRQADMPLRSAYALIGLKAQGLISYDDSTRLWDLTSEGKYYMGASIEEIVAEDGDAQEPPR